MDLTTQTLRQIDGLAATPDEQARLRCQLAGEFQEAGKYEAARSALGGLWRRVGERPVLEGLDKLTAAEVLLRVGALSGWIGSSRQIEGAQETAKDLISESLSIFESLGETERVAEARVDLAICYWREGALDEARLMLQDALSKLAPDSLQKARALLNSALVESSASRFNDALRILIGAEPLFQTAGGHTLKGGFHNELALVLRNLGSAENRGDYTDRALVEYEAASYHFEQAGHTRYVAAVQNNIGFLFHTLGNFTDAHRHLDRARRLYAGANADGNVAQVDESRARVLLAQGRNSEAERVVRTAVHTFEKGGEQSLLAEALTTHGTALARLGRTEVARAALERALDVASLAGDPETAGLAALALIEELSEHLSPEELRALYERADDMLARSQQPSTVARMRSCARRVFAAQGRKAEEASAAPHDFVHASERTAELLREARSFAAARGSVLITGETGTGKEVLARMIHQLSGRAGKFVSINCAAFTDTLFESQLFGHKKGSFTDAHEDYAGAARSAVGGTLFLDEIGELSTSNQGKLLRLIEHGEVHALGTMMPERIDLRVIAATNSNLRDLVATGRFRQDLFYRLETFCLHIPPLRERVEDIPALAKHFIEAARKRYAKRVTFTDESIEAMRALPLKGNARELQSLVERTMLTANDGALITREMVETVALRQTQTVSFAASWAGFSLKNEVKRYEERFIELALKDAGGKVTHAARLLGFKHHESLSSLLKTKHRKLQPARTPATPRRRSIIRKH